MSLEKDGLWKGGLWDPDVWADGVWAEAGIGLEVAEPLPRTPAVDFVLQGNHRPSDMQLFKAALLQRKAFNSEKLQAAKREKSELREMMELYARYRKAA